MQMEALTGGVPEGYQKVSSKTIQEKGSAEKLPKEVKTSGRASEVTEKKSTKSSVLVKKKSSKPVAPIEKKSSNKVSVPKEHVKADIATLEITPLGGMLQELNGEEQESAFQFPEKEPSESSIDAAITYLNSQIERTHCSYSYDEDTKRISIRVYNDETEELIREIPPEESLEAIKKIWEIAGILIDEKR